MESEILQSVFIDAFYILCTSLVVLSKYGVVIMSGQYSGRQTLKGQAIEVSSVISVWSYCVCCVGKLRCVVVAGDSNTLVLGAELRGVFVGENLNVELCCQE